MLLQRFDRNVCQPLKVLMKKILPFLALLAFISCKKEETKWISATVMQQGCYPGSWLVKLDAPDHSKQSFLCNPTQAMLSSSITHCGNSAVLLNLPSALGLAGARIKFSQWTDKGLLCFSSTLAPHHLEVTDVRAN